MQLGASILNMYHSTSYQWNDSLISDVPFARSLYVSLHRNELWTSEARWQI